MAEVELEAHDPAWFDRFEREANRIRDLTADPLGVVHVGSTAVPDLPAKPTLDVLAVYDDAEAMRAARDALLADEYHPDDVDAYTDHKESTIEALVARARRNGYDERLPEFARR